MQVEYLSAVSPMKTEPNTDNKRGQVCLLLCMYFQHSFSLSDPISLLLILRCSDSIYLGEKRNTKKKKYLFCLCFGSGIQTLSGRWAIILEIPSLSDTLRAWLWQRQERITFFETALRCPNDENLNFHSTTPAYPSFYKRYSSFSV